jgi:hypothetical protein
MLIASSWYLLRGEEDETATQGLLPIINQWNNQLNEQLKNMNNEQSIDRSCSGAPYVSRTVCESPPSKGGQTIRKTGRAETLDHAEEVLNVFASTE